MKTKKGGSRSAKKGGSRSAWKYEKTLSQRLSRGTQDLHYEDFDENKWKEIKEKIGDYTVKLIPDTSRYGMYSVLKAKFVNDPNQDIDDFLKNDLQNRIDLIQDPAYYTAREGNAHTRTPIHPYTHTHASRHTGAHTHIHAYLPA